MSTELKQGTLEWRQARIGRITGSRVGAILGSSPYKTKKAILKEMVSEYFGNHRDYDNDAMRWGRENEQKACHVYEFLYAPSEGLEETGFWTSGEFLGASPDRLVGSEGLLEVKCPYKLKDDERPVFESIEDRKDYWHQIQLQLHCTEREWCDFFQWSPHGHRNERVYKDPTWFATHADQFYAFVDLYKAALENAGAGDVLAESARWRAAVEAYDLAKRVHDAAKEDMDKAKETMIELCKDKDIDECSGGGYTLTKVESSGRVNYKKMVDALLPHAQCDDYRGEPSVTWRLTKNKGEE